MKYILAISSEINVSLVFLLTSDSSYLLGSEIFSCFNVAWASHLVAGLKINPTFRKAEKLALTNSESRVRHEQKSIANWRSIQLNVGQHLQHLWEKFIASLRPFRK